MGALAQTIEPLAIVTRNGRHPFSVEVARNDADRAQGLMFRRSLAPDRGMLFDFGRQTQPTVMWMKNTYIPLDMIFIRPDGAIARIAENAEPLSTRTISSGEPVLGRARSSGRHGGSARDQAGRSDRASAVFKAITSKDG